MLSLLRPATPEEIDSIKDKADLTVTSQVWTWPNEAGSPDLAVIRNCTEIDPMFFAETSGNSRRAFFGWALMNMLKATGVREIYFDIDTEGQEAYTAVLEKMGAVKTTPVPQWRYKLVL